MKIIERNNGITLLALSIYIVVILIVLGILVSIRSFFMKNVSVISEGGRYSATFDNFNSYFIHDVKNNSDANIAVDANNGNKTITFLDGTTYIYDLGNKMIYRQDTNNITKLKIASNVSVFNITKKTVMVNSVPKNIISVTMAISNSSKVLFNKSIDYTLKYW